MNKVLLEYVKEMEMDLRHAKKERVFITHSGCDAEIGNMSWHIKLHRTMY